MAEYKVKNNQDLFSICLQLYGDLSYMDQLISDNDLNYDDETTPGQVIEFDETIGILKVNNLRDTENISYSNGSNVFTDFVLGTQDDDYIVTDDGAFIRIDI